MDRNGESTVPLVKPPPLKPEAEISEMELVREIVALLNGRGGAAAKTIVEGSLFQKFKDLFQTPYYSKLVGQQPGYAGIPRWQKNIQFARHTAKKMGLLKPPQESG